MSGIVRLNRRAFMRNAGATAIAGAAGGLVGGASPAAAQSSTSIPRLANGKYDFDTPYNRVGTDCSRWDSPALRYPEGVFKYGMGVASMDFECAPCITEALQERIQHHNWGYLSTTQPLRDGILKWNGERHGLDLDPASIVISDGVYPGVIAALRSFVPIGNKVLLTTPAYSGFYGMARAARVDTVDSPMPYRHGRYAI
ncbi:MAG: hypothetical protein OXF01_00755, partial [Gemmatimonadetes bacterium]|nr:hypothetical protein [Gemmatimonadota bacterium]